MIAKKIRTTQEVASRFDELARQEKWFQIQEELFADHVRSVEPLHSPWLPNAEGKAVVRKKGEDWVSRIQEVHRTHTSQPVVSLHHFVVGREMDLSVQGLGRIQVNELMLYEVREGQIVLEQFFY